MTIELMNATNADWSTVCDNEGIVNIRKVICLDYLTKEIERTE